VFSIIDKDEYAASIIVSRLQESPGTDLGYLHGNLVGKGQYDAVGIAVEKEDIVSQQFCAIWDYEFTDEADENRPGEQDMVDRLWRRLSENFTDGKPRYLVIPDGHKLDDVDLLRSLKLMLPLLFIFKVGVRDAEIRIFSPDLRGLNIKDTLTQFCNILNKLRPVN